MATSLQINCLNWFTLYNINFSFYLAGMVDKTLNISAALSAFNSSSSCNFNMAIAAWKSTLDPSNKDTNRKTKVCLSREL